MDPTLEVLGSLLQGDCQREKIITKYCNPVIPVITFVIWSCLSSPNTLYPKFLQQFEKEIKIFGMLYNKYIFRLQPLCNVYIQYQLSNALLFSVHINMYMQMYTFHSHCAKYYSDFTQHYVLFNLLGETSICQVISLVKTI